MTKQSLYKKIGRICMLRRESLGVSIRKYAVLNHTTHQSLSSFEQGKTNSLYSFLSYLPILNGRDLGEIRKYVEDFKRDSK